MRLKVLEKVLPFVTHGLGIFAELAVLYHSPATPDTQIFPYLLWVVRETAVMNGIVAVL